MLEAAHGLVRCGACLSIFEADQHFIDPMPAASNDDGDHPTEDSVFISAPEEYFDPAEFLHQGEGEGSENDEGELLYAKSDVHDSSFDVFDVDPAVEDSKVHEQLLDSDFDVFEVGDIKHVEEQAKAEVQDNEFDIYDAGERVLTRRPDALKDSDAAGLDPTGKQRDVTDGQFQLKASFNFSPGMPQTIYVPQADAKISEPVPAQPTTSVDSAETTLPEAKDQSEKTLPPELVEDSVVILPEGPDAATLLQALKPTEDSEIILPPGPDAATMLAELKKSNDQSITDDQWDEPDQDLEEAVSEDPTFLPNESHQDQAEAADGNDEEFEFAVDDYSNALAEGLEWEEADLEVDESSFVILPEDPYQPSAFLHLAEEQAVEQSDPQQDAAAEPEVTEEPEVPTLTDFVTNAGEPAAENLEPAPEEYQPDAEQYEPAAEEENPAAEEDEPAVAEGDTKDVIRSRIMATELDEEVDHQEQLSADNLRAVRDFDTTLELEQRKQTGRSRSGLFLAAGLLVVVISSLVFFWLKMPELSQDPRFRPWYQSACNLVGCNLPTYVDPGRVETSNLVVRSHPERDNALELTAVFRNAAQFPQPFPLIELTFSDLSNRTIMVFEFLPDEYLPQALRGMPLMPVGAPVQITLDLADPGVDAVNYQMSFKAAPPRPR